MLGRTLLLSLDYSTLPMIRTLYCWVLSKEISSTIWGLGMIRPAIEPRNWTSICWLYIYIYVCVCDLMNNDKIWCIYFGLILKLAWSLQIYEVSLTKFETMERLISKFIKKWLGVPNSLTNVALYSSSTKLKLPTLSLVEEYKLGNAWLFQMLRDSRDPLVGNGRQK